MVISESFLETGSDCVPQHDRIKQEITSLSLATQASVSSSFHVSSCRPEAAACQGLSIQPRPNTDRQNCAFNSLFMPCPVPNGFTDELLALAGRDPGVRQCPPIVIAPGLQTSSQNYSFGNSWSHYDRLPSPPAPQLNLCCLPPFHHSYISAVPPLVSALSPSDRLGAVWPMHNLLARYGHLPPLLGGLFPANPAAALLSLTTARAPPLTSTTKCCGGADVDADDVDVDSAAENAAGQRRMSCDTTETRADDAAVLTTSSDSTSSPRLVTSTSDDLDCHQQPPDGGTGLSFFSPRFSRVSYFLFFRDNFLGRRFIDF